VATAGKICIVEVEEVVPTGSLDPDSIHLPDVYVQRIVKGESYEKPIEFRTIDTGD
jgi:3-oxoacid CoA-transferase subunit A